MKEGRTDVEGRKEVKERRKEDATERRLNGRKEGMKEGFQEGRKEGRKDCRTDLRSMCFVLPRVTGRKHASVKEVKERRKERRSI